MKKTLIALAVLAVSGAAFAQSTATISGSISVGVMDTGLAGAKAGVASLGGGANAINMYVDRDIDALMERTKTRPLVTGLISPRNALIFAISLEIIAFAILWAGANFLSACLALSATLFYVFVYSLWLKRTSKQNIVIGGAAGAFPPMIGWACATGASHPNRF